METCEELFYNIKIIVIYFIAKHLISENKIEIFFVFVCLNIIAEFILVWII